MFGFGRNREKNVRYEITGKFTIAGGSEADIDAELQKVENQVKMLQRLGTTGIEKWELIDKKRIE